MTYSTTYYYASTYKYVSSNQHGERFKQGDSERINVVRLACKRDNASDLEDLVVLGHTLNVPVHYEFKTNQAFIEIMSADAVRKSND